MAHSILHKVREIVMWGNSDNNVTAARVLSMPTWTSSKLWLPALPTRTYSCHESCEFCAFMLAEDICSTLLKELEGDVDADAGVGVDPSEFGSSDRD